jgi:hypothetical protein
MGVAEYELAVGRLKQGGVVVVTEIIWWVLVGAAIIVLIAGLYLAVINWNDTVKGTTVSVFLGAAVAFFLTVVAPLKPVDIEERFVAPLVLDSSGAPVWLGPNNSLPPPHIRLFLSGLRSITEAEGVPSPTPYAEVRQPTPTETAAAYSYTSQLLQYFLLKQLSRLGPEPGISVQAAEDIRFELWEAATAAVVSIPPEKIRDIQKNHFARTKEGIEILRMIPIKAPERSDVRLLDEPVGLELSRRGYYRITITLRSLGDLGAVPKGYEYLGGLRKTCRTYPYLVEIAAHFDRLTAASSYSSKAQAWVRTAITMLRRDSGGDD